MPAGWTHALSVTARSSSSYGDGKPLQQDDGTWVMFYRAHAGREGAGVRSRWNRGLIACMRDRVPVGVFIPAASGQYLNLGLAMVDSYDAATDGFVVHGSVSARADAEVFDATPEAFQWPGELEDQDLAQDERRWVEAQVVQRERQDAFRQSMLSLYGGVCAITRYDAPDALQSAHIIGYRGGPSQHPGNGLLLRADIHILFDRHLLSIEPDSMRVRTGSGLHPTKYAELDGRGAHLPGDNRLWPSKDRLRFHFEVFERVA